MPTDLHSEDSRRRILARSLELVGDREELARLLHTRPILLDAWLAGVTIIPERAFLQAVDIILGEGEKRPPFGIDPASKAEPAP